MRLRLRLSACITSLIIALTSGHNTSAQDSGLDTTFNPGSGPNSPVFALALDANGNVLVGGGFSTINQHPLTYIGRLFPDGSVDTSFYPGQGPTIGGYVTAAAADTNGLIYIGGLFTTFDGIQRNYFARLRHDGSLDLSWPNIAFDGGVSSIQVQSDGSLLVIGSFRHVGSTARMNVAKLNPDSNLNSTFNPGAGVTDGTINAVAFEPDGGIIIAGTFTTNSPVSRQGIARVTSNGSLDPSFDAGYIGGGSFQVVAAQPDGKLIVGGNFTSINGYSRIGIARLLTNGIVDSTFVLSSGIANASFSSLNLLANGKILISGGLNLQSYGFARLNADGSYDSTFNANANNLVNPVVVQSDGKILAGGYFTSIGGTNINYVARLNGTSTNALAFQLLGIARYAGMFLSGDVSNNYRVEWTTNLSSKSLWTPLVDLTLLTNPQFFVDPTPIAGKQKFYRGIALP